MSFYLVLRFLAKHSAALFFTAMAGLIFWLGHNTAAKQCNSAALTQQVQLLTAQINSYKHAAVKADALTTQLQQTQQQLQQEALQNAQLLAKTTTGNTCFNGATVRLLNRAATVPSTPSGTIATGATTAANTNQQPQPTDPIATDTDVANWANNAITQQADCKYRLDALIDYNTTGKE